MAAWFVYVLRCSDGTLYTGISRDVDARLAKHNQGKGARYTRGRGPVALVHKERKASQAAALRREAAIKALPRRRKLALLEGLARISPTRLRADRVGAGGLSGSPHTLSAPRASPSPSQGSHRQRPARRSVGRDGGAAPSPVATQRVVRDAG